MITNHARSKIIEQARVNGNRIDDMEIAELVGDDRLVLHMISTMIDEGILTKAFEPIPGTSYIMAYNLSERYK